MNALVNSLIIAGVLVLIFLALRQLVLWYFKINERLEIQKETNRLLNRILNETKPKNQDKLLTV